MVDWLCVFFQELTRWETYKIRRCQPLHVNQYCKNNRIISLRRTRKARAAKFFPSVQIQRPVWILYSPQWGGAVSTVPGYVLWSVRL